MVMMLLLLHVSQHLVCFGGPSSVLYLCQRGVKFWLSSWLCVCAGKGEIPAIFMALCLCHRRGVIFMYFWLDPGKIFMYCRIKFGQYSYYTWKYSCIIRTLSRQGIYPKTMAKGGRWAIAWAWIWLNFNWRFNPHAICFKMIPI